MDEPEIAGGKPSREEPILLYCVLKFATKELLSLWAPRPVPLASLSAFGDRLGMDVNDSTVHLRR
jgi:hypothetical protein